VIIRRLLVFLPVLAATSDALSAADISGDISSGLVGKEIAYESDGVKVSITEVSLSAEVDLLPLSATILPAHVSDLRIELRGDTETDDESAPSSGSVRTGASLSIACR
jgi:hypothetical protein